MRPVDELARGKSLRFLKGIPLLGGPGLASSGTDAFCHRTACLIPTGRGAVTPRMSANQCASLSAPRRQFPVQLTIITLRSPILGSSRHPLRRPRRRLSSSRPICSSSIECTKFPHASLIKSSLRRYHLPLRCCAQIAPVALLQKSHSPTRYANCSALFECANKIFISHNEELN